jgi:small nuclear ribonucleoprotein D3
MIESIPLKILNEGKPFIVTVETKNGKNYRGRLIHVEENMNCHLENVVFFNPNGVAKKAKRMFLRGSNLKIIVLPDLIQGGPLLEKNIHISK